MLSKLTTHKTCQSGQQNLLQLNNFTEFLSSEFFNDIFSNDSIHHVDKKLTQNKFSQPKWTYSTNQTQAVLFNWPSFLWLLYFCVWLAHTALTPTWETVSQPVIHQILVLLDVGRVQIKGHKSMWLHVTAHQQSSSLYSTFFIKFIFPGQCLNSAGSRRICDPAPQVWDPAPNVSDPPPIMSNQHNIELNEF